MAGGDFFGGLIGAGGDILGGLINQQTQENINQQNIQEQEYFANNGISMKVADAKRAGINPLAALGAATSSFSNVVGSDAMGSGLAHAGQDIGRAVKSAMSPDDQNFVDASHTLQLENAQLQNDLLGTQVILAKQRLMNQPGDGAPLPGPASVFDGVGRPVPGTSAAQFPPSVVPGFGGLSNKMIPDQAVTGDEAVVNARDIAQEGFFPVGRWQAEVRNKLLPSIGYWGPNDKRNWVYGVNPATGRAYKLHDVWDRGDWLQHFQDYTPSLWNNN